jgi:hypothetical protein
MPFPWDDETERAQTEQRAYGRAQRRGIGAALHREIARNPGEPFIGIFVVTDGGRAIELVAQFTDWPKLCESAARGDAVWVLERAVEDEVLTRVCQGDGRIENVASALAAPLVVRPDRLSQR